jgi:hypothetical protein
MSAPFWLSEIPVSAFERKQHVQSGMESMRLGNFVAAIASLREACLLEPEPSLLKLLAQCRYQAYLAEPPRASVDGPWPSETEDSFADVEGVPEIRAAELNSATLAAGIRKHGALLVRGLLSVQRASRLATGVSQTLHACEAWHRNGGELPDSPWYSRLPLAEGCDLLHARSWVEGAGGVWTADSPRMLYELTEFYDTSGVQDAIAGYFGERPLLSVGKSTLRRVPATQSVGDWHQDGAFMGSDIRSVNLWLSLSRCGEDASGLEYLPQRLQTVLPTGSHGAHFDWSVGQGMVEQTAAGMATVSPVFDPGDALLFDHFFLHRTGAPPGICKPRYAIESWFFAPSAYPAQQVPLWL